MFNFTIFAGAIACLTPRTEKESFLWILIFGGLYLVVFSIIFGISLLIIEKRGHYNFLRKKLAKYYRLSAAVFFTAVITGLAIGRKAKSEDPCSIESSLIGDLAGYLSIFSLMSAFILMVLIIFSFDRVDSGLRKLFRKIRTSKR